MGNSEKKLYEDDWWPSEARKRPDFTDIWNAAKVQEALAAKTDEEIADLLLHVWAGMDCMTPAAIVVEEAIEWLRRSERRKEE